MKSNLIIKLYNNTNKSYVSPGSFNVDGDGKISIWDKNTERWIFAPPNYTLEICMGKNVISKKGRLKG